MSSSSGTGSSESRGTVTVEQLIGECFVKTAQTILSSRVPEAPSAMSKERNAKRSAWFKLELQERDSAKDALDRWRMERGVGLPLVLEIYLYPSGHSVSEDTPGTLLERWVVHYSPATAMPLPLATGGLSRSQLARFNPQAVYKRLTLLIRSLYSYCRVLPAYRLYRTACAAHHTSAPFQIRYRLHSTLPQRGDVVSSRMQRYEFSSVDTADGQFKLCVDYQPASTVRVLGQAAVRLPRPAIIPDYVKGVTQIEEHTTTDGFSTTPTGLETAPSAPAALATTPRRRGWSSSFRLAPARSYESPLPGSSPSSRYSTSTGFIYNRNTSATSGQRIGGGISPQETTPRSGEDATSSSSRALSSHQTETVGPQASSSLPRSLSTPGRHMTRARPPLPPSAPSPGFHRPHGFGNVSPAMSPGAAEGVGMDEGEEEEEESEEESAFAVESGSAGRRISPPMQIPRVVGALHRRAKARPPGLRSSGDLGALGHSGAGSNAGVPQQVAKPLSAPAVSHMTMASDIPSGDDLPTTMTAGMEFKPSSTAETTFAADDDCAPAAGGITTPLLPSDPSSSSSSASSGDARAHVPLTPLNITSEVPSPLHLDPHSFTESLVSSSAPYPASCSPDLPFALTPCARYSCSPASYTSGGGGIISTGGHHVVSHAAGTLNSGSATLLSRPSPGQSSGSGGSGATSPRNLQTAVLAPSPPLSGREIPSGMALMRRASWGARSTSYSGIIGDGTGSGAGAGGAAPLVGYSVSPLQDNGMLESVLSVSTPRHLFRAGSGLTGRLTHASSAVSDLSGRLGSGPGGGGGSGVDGTGRNARDPLLLTFPSGDVDRAEGSARRVSGGNSLSSAGGSGVRGGAMSSSSQMHIPREESDQLPFDFTADGSDHSEAGLWGNPETSASPAESSHQAASPRTQHAPPPGAAVVDHAQARMRENSTPPPSTVAPANPAFNMVSSAAAVGAFMHLVREAQPLAGMGPVPLKSGMGQLAALRSKLQTQGVE